MRRKRTVHFFCDTLSKPIVRVCDQEGCQEEGFYRAPKAQDLCEYYLFCLTHVRHYNATWNYYRGMSPESYEKSRQEDVTWHRPTWPLGKGSPFKKIGDIDAALFFNAAPSNTTTLSPEIQKALQAFNLSLPLTSSQLKKRYHALVKRYHPDAHSLDKEGGEEKLKHINQAYGVLKKFLRGV